MSTVSVELDTDELMDAISPENCIDHFGTSAFIDAIGISNIIEYFESEIDCLYSGDVAKLKKVLESK